MNETFHKANLSKKKKLLKRSLKLLKKEESAAWNSSTDTRTSNCILKKIKNGNEKHQEA